MRKENTSFNPDNKQIKNAVTHKSGEAGGMLVGKRHSEGGIKAINKSTGQPLEMEGGEVVITRNAVSDPKKRSFNGKMMTNREILSTINQSGGGVSFADGGEVPEKIFFDCEASYEYGGKTMCGKDLANKMRKGGEVYESDTDATEIDEVIASLDDVMALEAAEAGMFEFGGETDDIENIIKGDFFVVFYPNQSIDEIDFMAIDKIFTEKFGNGIRFFRKLRYEGNILNYFENGKLYSFRISRIDDFRDYSSEVVFEKIESFSGTNFSGYGLGPVDEEEGKKLSDEIVENYPSQIINQKGELETKYYGKGKSKISFFADIFGNLTFQVFGTAKDKKFFVDSKDVNKFFNPTVKTKVESVFFSYNDFSFEAFSLNELIQGLKELKKERNRIVSFVVRFNGDLETRFLLFYYDKKPRKYYQVNESLVPTNLDTKPKDFLNSFFHSFRSQSNFAVDFMPFILGESEASKKSTAEREEAKRIQKEQAEKERIEKELKESYLADIENVNYLSMLKEVGENDSEILDLKKLLNSFQGVKYSTERAKIIKELLRIYNSKKNDYFNTLDDFKIDKLFSDEGLLSYYFNQTTQSPVQKLEEACKMPTPNGGESNLPYGAYLNVRSLQFKEWFGYWEEAYESNNYNGCSIMIDENVEPKIFYHGVTRFDKNQKASNMGSGVTRPFGAFTPSKFPASYFSDKRSYAEFYSGQSEDLPVKRSGFIYPVFLKIERPLDLRPLGFEASYDDFIDYIKIVSGISIEKSKSFSDRLKNTDGNNPVWAYVRNDIQIIEALKDYGYDSIIQIGDIPVYGKNGEPLSDRSQWRKEDEYLTFYPTQVKSAVSKKSFFLDTFDDIRFKKGGYVSI